MSVNLREIYLHKGAPGVISLIDNSAVGKSKIFRPIIDKIPPLQAFRLITGFDSNIGKNGLVSASQELLKTLNFELSCEGTIPPNLQNKKTPLIVISTHEGLIEPIYIAQLLKREDFFMIAGMENVRYGSNLAKHLLRVRPSKFAGEKSSLLYGPEMTKEEIMAMNDASLESAAHEVANGSMLSIFPWGGRGTESGEWYNGLSRIIHRIPSEMRNKVNILPIYFTGHNRESLKEFIKELLTHGKTTKKRSVLAKIGSPITIDQVINDQETHNTTANIKNYYLTLFGKQTSNVTSLNDLQFDYLQSDRS